MRNMRCFLFGHDAEGTNTLRKTHNSVKNIGPSKLQKHTNENE